MKAETLREAAKLLTQRDAIERGLKRIKEDGDKIVESSLCGTIETPHLMRAGYEPRVYATFTVVFMQELLETALRKIDKELLALGVEI